MKTFDVNLIVGYLMMLLYVYMGFGLWVVGFRCEARLAFTANGTKGGTGSKGGGRVLFALLGGEAMKRVVVWVLAQNG